MYVFFLYNYFSFDKSLVISKSLERSKGLERNLVCEECGKSFSSKSRLNDHRIVHHTNERSFKCHLCERAYFLKNHLNDHIKKGHPTSLDHACELCGKRFPLNSLLTMHKKDVHAKVPCQNCGKLISPRRQTHKCKPFKLKSKLGKVSNDNYPQSK